VKALSIRQPWAWLICVGMPVNCFEKAYNPDGKSYSIKVKDEIGVVYKDIENRNWYTDFRERIYVHAGKRVDNDAQVWLMEKGFSPMLVLMLYSNKIPRGAIIGEVDITGCVEKSDSPWFVGKYGFTLANPVLYDKPIPCKGRLGFFIPDIRGADGE